MVSADGKKIPVFVSPDGLIEGVAVDPAETVVTPDTTTPVVVPVT
jgi:hypothetical protein